MEREEANKTDEEGAVKQEEENEAKGAVELEEEDEATEEGAVQWEQAVFRLQVTCAHFQ